MVSLAMYANDATPLCAAGDSVAVVIDDSHDIILPEKNYSRFDRGLRNHLFVPKGQWAFGATAAYGEFSTDDIQLLSIMKDFDFKGKTVSVSPQVAYFFRDNQSIGFRLGYSQNIFDLGSLSFDFDEDISFALKNISYHTKNYSASVYYRHYVGLDKSRRFALFNEVDLKFASGQGEFVRYYNDQPRNTRTDMQEVSLNFSPGVCVFMHEYVSFNVSFGIFGVYLKKEKQNTNSTEYGERFSSGANFKFNLLNLNMGVAIHI